MRIIRLKIKLNAKVNYTTLMENVYYKLFNSIYRVMAERITQIWRSDRKYQTRFHRESKIENVI